MSRGKLIAAGFVLLFVLHQDFWWRDDATLLFGFLPISLAYHVGWTLLTAFGWFLVTRLAWPFHWDEAPPAAPASTSVSVDRSAAP